MSFKNGLALVRRIEDAIRSLQGAGEAVEEATSRPRTAAATTQASR